VLENFPRASLLLLWGDWCASDRQTTGHGGGHEERGLAASTEVQSQRDLARVLVVVVVVMVMRENGAK